ADVLIHCAGPFTHTGKPVATAAAEGGCHYVDHALEQHHTKWMFEAMSEPARKAGIAMITAMSFYGGMGDLLAGAVAGGMTDIERVISAYAVSGWRLTAGAKKTAELLFADTQRITYADGAQHVGYVEPRNAVFPFPPPLGPRTMIAPVPFSEVVTVPRHVPAKTVEAQLTAHTFEEPEAFTSEDVDAATRAGSSFTVAVQVITEKGGRAGQVRGQDLWRLSALASVEAAVRLAENPGSPGVYGPAEAFPAEPFLRDLERLGLFTLTLPEEEER
ncbi:saccharopine dehydrogenase NADP-binding domain-containing protein, partial [Nonomuraea sp. NPDC049784]|uniref:saccharopine dehydrogenase NADP-binding domain-containing protein n=1 Tax=Nonomuraea sp. NPDC049784 TaxID=3154361 RepID=UPI0033E027EC